VTKKSNHHNFHAHPDLMPNKRKSFFFDIFIYPEFSPVIILYSLNC